MTKREARRIAYQLAGSYLESDADIADLDEYDEREDGMIREAMRDIAESLRRRGEGAR